MTAGDTLKARLLRELRAHRHPLATGDLARRCAWRHARPVQTTLTVLLVLEAQDAAPDGKLSHSVLHAIRGMCRHVLLSDEVPAAPVAPPPSSDILSGRSLCGDCRA